MRLGASRANGVHRANPPVPLPPGSKSLDPYPSLWDAFPWLPPKPKTAQKSRFSLCRFAAICRSLCRIETIVHGRVLAQPSSGKLNPRQRRPGDPVQETGRRTAALENCPERSEERREGKGGVNP